MQSHQSLHHLGLLFKHLMFLLDAGIYCYGLPNLKIPSYPYLHFTLVNSLYLYSTFKYGTYTIEIEKDMKIVFQFVQPSTRLLFIFIGEICFIYNSSIQTNNICAC